MASPESPVLLVLVGLLAAGGGFVLLGATEGRTGSILIVGGVLLLFTGIGFAVEPSPGTT